MEGFPSSVRGRILFIDKDNLNTDGIYGSKHTYRDDMTPEQMAAVTFENYDPNFNTLYQKGDVVVGGLNFGSGSSREQAATALKYKGIVVGIKSAHFNGPEWTPYINAEEVGKIAGFLKILGSYPAAVI